MTSRGVVIRTTQLPAQAPATTSRDSVIKPPSPDGGLGGGGQELYREQGVLDCVLRSTDDGFLLEQELRFRMGQLRLSGAKEGSKL